MKTKLLKKIRERFEWGFKEDGTPVIIDYQTSRSILVDEEFIRRKYGPKEKSLEEYYNIDFSTLQKRILIAELGRPFGWDYDMNKKRFKAGRSRVEKTRKAGNVIINQKPKTKN